MIECGIPDVYIVTQEGYEASHNCAPSMRVEQAYALHVMK